VTGQVWVESLPVPFAKTLIDTMLFHLNWLLPCQLPPAVAAVALKYDHNLLIECADYGDGEAAAFEAKLTKLAADRGSIVYYRCADDAEVQAVKRFRFVGNPSFRTWCVGHGLQGLSVDYALPKRFEEVPELLNAAPAVKRMRYGHYGCNVIHESLAFAPGVDVKAEKAAIKRRLEALGGVLPAEHGFGTEYPAPADSQKRWMAMDPTNTMNPGAWLLATPENCSATLDVSSLEGGSADDADDGGGEAPLMLLTITSVPQNAKRHTQPSPAEESRFSGCVRRV
jgi:D-lactate dehydrogenase